MSTKEAAPTQPNPRQWVFYYDGDCGICQRSVRWLGRLDLGRRVAWVPFQSLDAPPEGLTWSDLDQAAYLYSDAGKRFPGFYAFRRLTLKVALLWPLAPIFWFPGVQLPGVLVYRWVANNRYRLSRCAVPADRVPRDTEASIPGRDGQ